jgi:hypothetical protein
MSAVRAALILFLINLITISALADVGLVKKDLQPFYDQFAKAIKTRNLDAASSRYLPTFILKTETGQIQRLGEWKLILKSNLAMMSGVTSVEAPIETIERKGSEFIVTGILRITGTSLPDRFGKTHILSLTRQTRLLWTKTKTGWMASKGEQLRAALTQDGKPYHFEAIPATLQQPIR